MNSTNKNKVTATINHTLIMNKNIDETFQENLEREILRKIFAANDDKQTYKKIMPLIDGKMFTNKFYRDVTESAKELFNTQGEFDDLQVLENCKSKIKYKKTSDILKELNNFASECTCVSNYKYYVKNIIKNYIQKLYINAECKEDIEKIKEEENKYSLVDNVRLLSEGAQFRVLDYYDSFETAIKTGYKNIDKLLGSVQGGDFIILAGATGMGKTCMALNLIKNISLTKKVLLFSLEMRIEQLQNRIICSELGFDVSGLRKYNFTDEQLERYRLYATNEFCKFNVLVCDEFNITVEKIKQTIQKNNDVDIIFIDYLGLINGDKNRTSYEKYSEISRELKMMAVEMNKPIVALHQLNRATKDRKDKRPRLSDLRDSGKIEQDADMIWLVYRPAYYEPEKNKDLIQFIIGKNRHGLANYAINLCYDPSRQKITDRISVDTF